MSTGPFNKQILTDWWFLRMKDRPDGRSGHMYTCPIALTIGMILWRWKKYETHSVNWERSNTWSHYDDTYEPARIVARKLNGGHGFSPPINIPRWIINLEVKLHYLSLHWKARKLRKEQQ